MDLAKLIFRQVEEENPFSENLIKWKWTFNGSTAIAGNEIRSYSSKWINVGWFTGNNLVDFEFPAHGDTWNLFVVSS